MKKSKQAELARRQLDETFRLAEAKGLAQRPTRGWIRAIRDALGMTSRQLAARMRISQPGVTKLERSELDATISLASLQRAAEALDCSLVYALVPRSTLEETVHRRAHELAVDDLKGINQTMRLEDQTISDEQLAARVEEYASRLMTEGRLWDSVPRRPHA